MINKAYAILMLGELLPIDNEYYRYSNYTPTDNQIRSAKKLVPSDLTQRAIFAEYTLELLSCSPGWVDYVQNVDTTNTYETKVLDTSARLNDDPLKRLADWESAYCVGATVSDLDPILDRIVNKLFTLLGN